MNSEDYKNYATWPNTNMKILKELLFDATIINPNNEVLCTTEIGMQPSLFQPGVSSSRSPLMVMSIRASLIDYAIFLYVEDSYQHVIKNRIKFSDITNCICT